MTRVRLANIPFLAAAVLVTAAAYTFAQAPRSPKRVALLVGVNEYQKRGFADLRWAENDVTEIAQELTRRGYDRVVTLTGASEPGLRPTKANVEKQLDHLLTDVHKNDIVLIYFSGQGQQIHVVRNDGTRTDDAFFCPSDAVLNDPKTMISLTKLTDETLHQRGGKNFVVVDACRDFVADRERGITGLSIPLAQDTSILFSCSAGQLSLEKGDLKHGVFSWAVLYVIRNTPGDLTWSHFVAEVEDVMVEKFPTQNPVSAGSVGRVVLVPAVRGRVK